MSQPFERFRKHTIGRNIIISASAILRDFLFSDDGFVFFIFFVSVVVHGHLALPALSHTWRFYSIIFRKVHLFSVQGSMPGFLFSVLSIEGGLLQSGDRQGRLERNNSSHFETATESSRSQVLMELIMLCTFLLLCICQVS